MTRVLITGGAGFIGSHHVHHALTAHSDWRVTVLDKLTYAGNLANLEDLQGHPRYRFLRGDVASRRDVVPALKDAAPDEGTRARFGVKQVLVVSEGLLIYLTGEQVGALAGDLAAQSSFGWWLIDLASPGLLKMMERTWGRAVTSNAPFRFAPAEGTRFFEPFGWRETEFRSTWEESLRLKRTMRLAWLWGLLGRLYPKRKREEFRRFSGIALLGRR